MAHAPSRGRRLSGDESNNGLRHIVPGEGCGLSFRRAANLSDHHDSIRLIIRLKQTQRVYMRCPNYWVAANADRG